MLAHYIQWSQTGRDFKHYERIRRSEQRRTEVQVRSQGSFWVLEFRCHLTSISSLPMILSGLEDCLWIECRGRGIVSNEEAGFTVGSCDRRASKRSLIERSFFLHAYVFIPDRRVECGLQKEGVIQDRFHCQENFCIPEIPPLRKLAQHCSPHSCVVSTRSDYSGWITLLLKQEALALSWFFSQENGNRAIQFRLLSEQAIICFLVYLINISCWYSKSLLNMTINLQSLWTYIQSMHDLTKHTSGNKFLVTGSTYCWLNQQLLGFPQLIADPLWTLWLHRKSILCASDLSVSTHALCCFAAASASAFARTEFPSCEASKSEHRNNWM